MKEGYRIGQREMLRQGVVVITETSADPTGSSGTGVKLQNCPELRQGGWGLDPTHRPVTGCRLTWGGHISLGMAAVFEGTWEIPRKGTVMGHQPTFLTAW